MTLFQRLRFAWQLRRRVLPLGERTQIMAIINLTPDSFSGDGLAERGLAAAVHAAVYAIDHGADILDIGAESTRPGAQPISAAQEQDRLLPMLEELFRERPSALVSVDTYHAATATAAAALGAEIVNDVSGLQWDAEMASAVRLTGCGLVLMHTRGRPPEWKHLPAQGGQAMLRHVVQGLTEGLSLAERSGIALASIVLDPGFSFGKVGTENFTLLAELGVLHQLERPVLIGLSRKGFLGEAVRNVRANFPDELPSVARKNATLAANVAAILSGAHIVRVHDLQETREAAAIADAILAARKGA